MKAMVEKYIIKASIDNRSQEEVDSTPNYYAAEGDISIRGKDYGDIMFRFLDLCQGYCVSRDAAARVIGVSNRMTQTPRRKSKQYAQFLQTLFNKGVFRDGIDTEGKVFKVYTIGVRDYLELILNGRV